jgi:hypothetical protein
MQPATDSLTVEGSARWVFSPGEGATADRAMRNIQIFRWLEAIQTESVSGAGEVDAEIASELRRLDAKLSMVLDLLLDRTGLGLDSTLAREYSLSAAGVTLNVDSAPSANEPREGDVGMLDWYPEPRWPTALRFVARAVSTHDRQICFEFTDVGDAERDCLERWIFREHRRARERYR